MRKAGSSETRKDCFGLLHLRHLCQLVLNRLDRDIPGESERAMLERAQLSEISEQLPSSAK